METREARLAPLELIYLTLSELLSETGVFVWYSEMSAEPVVLINLAYHGCL